MNKIKDFFYNKNDLIIVLLILAAAAFIIYVRIGVIMDYPEKVASEVAATQTEMTTAETSEATDDQSSSAAVTIEITDSDTSVTVAQKLYKAGLITSDTEFEGYITNSGKSDSLKTGTFQIPSGATDEEILKIIAN